VSEEAAAAAALSVPTVLPRIPPGASDLVPSVVAAAPAPPRVFVGIAEAGVASLFARWPPPRPLKPPPRPPKPPPPPNTEPMPRTLLVELALSRDVLLLFVDDGAFKDDTDDVGLLLVLLKRSCNCAMS